MMTFYKRTTLHPRTPQRRGSVVIIILWAVSLAAIITVGVQLSSHRQSTLGRDALERVQARWAARSGVEQTIAVMHLHTERPDPEDAFAMVREMEYVAFGNTVGASWDIRHFAHGREWPGPMDEHSKMNINTIDMPLLMVLDNMWLDIADAILEWRSPDYESMGLGVGRDYYLSLNPPYEQRKDRYQNIAELELVAGIWPKHLRGEDWNLNSRLDANENDGTMTFPPDNQDGILDAGWSASLTATSVAGGATTSGLPRIHLAKAKIADVMERLEIEERQAKALIRFGRNEESKLEQLLVTPIGNIDAQGRASQSPYNTAMPDLTPAQLRAVFDELTLIDPLDRPSGKMNLNTVSADLFRRILLDIYMTEPVVADEILYMRDSRTQGLLSLADLKEIPEVSPELLVQLGAMFDTRSNVYTISSKGRSMSTGAEVEIVVVVDRSTIPVRILEYREQ